MERQGTCAPFAANHASLFLLFDIWQHFLLLSAFAFRLPIHSHFHHSSCRVCECALFINDVRPMYTLLSRHFYVRRFYSSSHSTLKPQHVDCWAMDNGILKIDVWGSRLATHHFYNIRYSFWCIYYAQYLIANCCSFVPLRGEKKIQGFRQRKKRNVNGRGWLSEHAEIVPQARITTITNVFDSICSFRCCCRYCRRCVWSSQEFYTFSSLHLTGMWDMWARELFLLHIIDILVFLEAALIWFRINIDTEIAARHF